MENVFNNISWTTMKIHPYNKLSLRLGANVSVYEKLIHDSIKASLGIVQFHSGKLILFAGHSSSNSLRWVPYARMPNEQLSKQPSQYCKFDQMAKVVKKKKIAHLLDRVAYFKFYLSPLNKTIKRKHWVYIQQRRRYNLKVAWWILWFSVWGSREI